MPASVEALCVEHLALVHFEVRVISARLPQHVYSDDLISAGMAALVSAARAFDPTLGVPFARYAVRRIRGALLDELRSADWATRSLRAKVRRRDAVREQLSVKLGRSPTVIETSEAMGLTAADLQRLDIDLHTSVVLRLDVIAAAPGGDALLPATVETPEATLVARERRAYLRDAVATLPERLRMVIRGCYFEERSLSDLAADLGVSQSRVSQMRAEGLRLLRDGLNSQLDPALMARPQAADGAAARRKDAYYGQIASRSSYRDRLSPEVATAGSARTA